MRCFWHNNWRLCHVMFDREKMTKNEYSRRATGGAWQQAHRGAIVAGGFFTVAALNPVCFIPSEAAR